MKELIEKKIYLKAIDKYGPKAQTDMFHEEIGEVLQAVNKCKRNNNDQNAEHLAEELADLQIMLNQMILMIDGGEKRFEYYKNKKLKRLEKNLEDDI